MKETYSKAMKQVFEDEGGYTNDAADPGGPTNWGITIADARMYWKSDATADDVHHMPKEVAEDIYRKHYADPIQYDSLPAGVDYALLDYGINSGISRAVKVAQRLVNVPVDGKMGEQTLKVIRSKDPVNLINAIYDERLSFLQSLSTWSVFGRGWASRVKRGRALALSMVKDKSNIPAIVTTAVVTSSGVGAASQHPQLWPYILAGTLVALLATYLIYKWLNKKEPSDVVQN